MPIATPACGSSVSPSWAEGKRAAKSAATPDFAPIFGFEMTCGKAHGLGHVEDETNGDRSLTRNRLRLDIMPLLRELVKEGMVDGIEIDHPSNSPEDRAECITLCEQYGLIRTGGTDFHGANHKKVHPVGTCITPDDQIARIEELAHKRKK